MNGKEDNLTPEIEEQWRKWSQTEPAIDERQLRRNLLNRIPDRRPQRRLRLVLVAAAASLLAVLIGFEATRVPPGSGVFEDQMLVHDPGDNVILVLREGSDPIYVAIDRSHATNGGNR